MTLIAAWMPQRPLRWWRQVVQHLKELSTHFVDFLRSAMLEGVKRPVEAKSARPRQRPKDHRQRVELSRSAKESEQRYRKGIGPLFSFRPVENDAAVANCRE